MAAIPEAVKYNSIQESFHGEAACFGQQKQARIHKVI